jgi:hypothetical protein
MSRAAAAKLAGITARQKELQVRVRNCRSVLGSVSKGAFIERKRELYGVHIGRRASDAKQQKSRWNRTRSRPGNYHLRYVRSTRIRKVMWRLESSFRGNVGRVSSEGHFKAMV